MLTLIFSLTHKGSDCIQSVQVDFRKTYHAAGITLNMAPFST